MKVGIIQSNYIPWRGYFDFIDDVDLFVIHDDLQYTKGDWRNRNQIKTATGINWLTVPVKYQKTAQLIQDTPIDHAQKWQLAHINKFTASYFEAPYLETAIALWRTAFDHQDATISELNIRLIHLICDFLDIKTPFVHSRELQVTGTKTDRVVQILKRVGATSYLSGPTAKAYLDESLLHENGFQLEYKTYQYEAYPQLHGDFVNYVTVLDLIANVGDDAKHWLKSARPNEAIHFEAIAVPANV